MKLSIKNIGKIESADIELNGITVICGENNTGKSTIGKVLFSYFNSMCDFESKIKEQKSSAIRNCMLKYCTTANSIFYLDELDEELNELVSSDRNNISIKNISLLISRHTDIRNVKALSEDIYSVLTMQNEDLMSEYVFRYFMDVFNGQIRNENSGLRQQGIVKTIFKSGTNAINFFTTKCKLNQEVPIVHCAYYINNPFIVDYLNINWRWSKSILSELDSNVIDTINSAKLEQTFDKMTDIFDAVSNKDKLDEIRKLLSRAYNGKTIKKNGLYFYNDGNSDIEFRNLSTGLKSFTLIERLLESGKLKSKDVLILDEPEIHLHPEWQLVYAELIVLLQKTFNLTILLVTHSFHFLESLKFFIDKYDISDYADFYTPQKSKNGFIITKTDSALSDSMKSLSEPSFKLADWKFELEMEQNDESKTD